LAISGFRQAKLLGKLSPDWELVIIGAEGWNEKPLASGLRKGIFGKDVIYNEDVDDFELQRVFNESRIVLSAAAAEGFGLPPLEGMSSGCIPVVSDIPQHRETVRENGLYFSGNEPTAIANALEEASILSEQNGTEIATKLRNYVEANYSEKVIGEKWIDFINSLKK
jgi:glycosyltransferase involved in cell wall biosynthesis